ncbi:MAG: replication initiation protein [Aliarcobacter sp.]|nr:replication initiation protein [Aliarcobacter sp.]
MTNKITIIEKDRKIHCEILKQNNLIECSFKELETWSEIHHDLFNELIAIFQNYEHKNGLFEDMNRRIYVRRTTLEKNINIRRKSNQEIFELLKKMRDTSFVIKGIYQSNGYKTTAAISFFNYVYLHEKPGKESYFEIEYTELFAMLCHKNYSLKYGNYCKLNLQKTISLKSKYAKALYELIESNKYKKQFTFKEEELKSLLRYDVKHYRFAGLVREIEKVYKVVNSNVKFTYTAHKETKSLTFKIEK